MKSALDAGSITANAVRRLHLARTGWKTSENSGPQNTYAQGPSEAYVQGLHLIQAPNGDVNAG